MIQAEAGWIDTVDGKVLVPKIIAHVRRLPGLWLDPFVVSPSDVTRVRSAECIEHAPTLSSIGQSSAHCRDEHLAFFQYVCHWA